jgi:ABC-type molybdate transport system substrate-binding protein
MRIVWGMLAALAAGPAMAWDSPTPDVVLYCTRPLAGPCRALAQGYRAQTGIEVHVFLNASAGLAGLVRHRARADVVIADAATTDDLAGHGFADPASVVALGTDPFVLVAKAALPPAAAPALLASHSVTLPDPTTAASFNGPDVLQAAAAGAPLPPTRGVSDSPDVVADVQAGDADIGLVTLADARLAGLPVVARLNVAPLAVKAALVTLRQSRNAAALIAYAQSGAGQERLRNTGLETAP